MLVLGEVAIKLLRCSVQINDFKIGTFLRKQHKHTTNTTRTHDEKLKH